MSKEKKRKKTMPGKSWSKFNKSGRRKDKKKLTMKTEILRKVGNRAGRKIIEEKKKKNKKTNSSQIWNQKWETKINNVLNIRKNNYENIIRYTKHVKLTIRKENVFKTKKINGRNNEKNWKNEKLWLK